MKEFYVVLVIVALINCISLGRITGPGNSSGRKGSNALFAGSTALLLAVSTLFTVVALSAINRQSGSTLPPWLPVLLASVTTGLMLLPLSAWFDRFVAIPHRRRRQLLAAAGIEAAILSSLLLQPYAGQQPWPALLWVLLWATGAGFGLLIVIMVFADLRLRLRVSDAPESWRGLPLELVTAGILALALLSPAGGMF